jgi:CheY-like chemotaxis protein/glycine cleavage system H lipoate-binding protein
MEGRTRILVVDDELPVCKSVSKALEAKYLVETALSGEEAVRKVNSADYDVVITDLMMPGLSGIDLLRQLGESRPKTSVIMITGYPSIKSAVESIKQGAYDYIPKPFTPDELRSVVSRALESRRYHEAGGHGEGEAVIAAPQGVYSIPGNSWAVVEPDGRVRVGAAPVFIKARRNISGLELPEEGQMRYQGEAFVRIRDGNDMIHKVWTPLTGRVVAVNRALTEDTAKLERDPYGEGWLAVLSPTNLESELLNLASPRE